MEEDKGGNRGVGKGLSGSGGSGRRGGVEERLSPVVASGGLRTEALPEGNQGFAIGNRAREHFFFLFGLTLLLFYLFFVESFLGSLPRMNL